MSIAVVGNVAGDSLPVETDTAYQKMVKSALVDTGNNYRVKTVIKKNKKGKNCICIDFLVLGGIILPRKHKKRFVIINRRTRIFCKHSISKANIRPFC